MPCLFNSYDPYFKQPFGAVRAGQTVRLSLCIPEELGYVDPHLVLIDRDLPAFAILPDDHTAVGFVGNECLVDLLGPRGQQAERGSEG